MSSIARGSTQMRKALQPKLKAVRQQIARHAKQAGAREAKQLAALDEYALALVTALNFEGRLPFDYPAVAAAQALEEVASSLERLEKKGRESNQTCKQKLARLKTIVAERSQWAQQIASRNAHAAMGLGCRAYS